MRACVRGSPARVCARSEVAKLTSSMTVEQMQARLAQLQAEVRGVGLTAGRAVGRALMFGAGSLWRRFTERAQRHAAQGAAGGWQHDLARGREKDQCRVRVQRQDVASAQAQGRSADQVSWGTSSSTLLDGLLTSDSRALGWGRGSAVQGDPGHDHGKLAAQAQGPDGTVRPHAAAASLAPQVPDPSERGPVFVQEAIGIETDENAGVQLPAS